MCLELYEGYLFSYYRLCIVRLYIIYVCIYKISLWVVVGGYKGFCNVGLHKLLRIELPQIARTQSKQLLNIYSTTRVV